MGSPLDDLLDLDRAWPVTKREIRRPGVRSPFESELIVRNLDEWLEGVRRRIISAAYAPRRWPIVELPEPVERYEIDQVVGGAVQRALGRQRP